MVNELLWLFLLLFNFLSIIVCYRIWGKSGLYVWIPIATIAANIQVTKTIELFGIEATLGNIVYATSFLATDILNENYDKKSASKAVGIGFFSLIVFTISMNLALLFIPSSSDFVHESMSNIFSILPRIVAASLIAYAVSQLHDVWSYDMWKRRKPSKRYIWLRNNASTLVSQLLDSIIFTTIAFWGVFSGNVLLEITITTYILKVIVAAADTPFIYIAQKWKESGKINR